MFMEGNTNCQFGDAMCGDNAGYIRRIRRKQPTCQTCRAVHAEYVRVRRALKILKGKDN